MSEVKKQTSSNVNIKIKNILYVIFSILFVTSICLNVFQYFKGQDSSGVIGVSSVCKIDDINKFNEIVESEDTSSNSLADISNEIQSRPDWEDDINCNYIVFNDASFKLDSDKMKTVLIKIEALNNDGNSIDGRFSVLKNIKSMQSESEITTETVGGRV